MVCALACLPLPAQAAEPSEPVALFDGKSLDGWTQVNGKAPYTVEDGAIVGTYVMGSPNSFLATDKEYDDFILEFDVKADPGVNSGVQIRSHSTPEFQNGRVHGYQAEIDAKEPGKSGGIYDEARAGWVADIRETGAGEKVAAAWKSGDWNHYKIEAIGNRIRTWVNGVPAADFTEATDPRGFIALQVHSIGSEAEAGKKVRWRNLQIIPAKGWQDSGINDAKGE